MAAPIEEFQHPGPRREISTLPGSEAPQGKRKIFARPFRLCFLKTETQEITWVKVVTLGGLETVAQRIAEGIYTPVNAWATLDRQLWGLLAEHCGFLRYEGPGGELDAGIRPLGTGINSLTHDLSELCGGFDPAISVLAQMRETVMRDMDARQPVDLERTENYVKSDGVNLTEQGEAELAKLIYGDGQEIKSKMDADNAVVIADRTEVDLEEAEIAEAVAESKELEERTGPEATAAGEKVEQARCVDQAFETPPDEEDDES